MRNGICLILTMAFSVFAATNAVAAEPKPTTISVPGMHCGGCAKKITDQIKTVPFVESAEADLKSKTVKVVARSGKVISPKALWEAVEKADKLPTKIDGPNGSFTEKPKS